MMQRQTLFIGIVILCILVASIGYSLWESDGLTTYISEPVNPLDEPANVLTPRDQITGAVCEFARPAHTTLFTNGDALLVRMSPPQQRRTYLLRRAGVVYRWVNESDRGTVVSVRQIATTSDAVSATNGTGSQATARLATLLTDADTSSLWDALIRRLRVCQQRTVSASVFKPAATVQFATSSSL